MNRTNPVRQFFLAFVGCMSKLLSLNNSTESSSFAEKWNMSESDTKLLISMLALEKVKDWRNLTANDANEWLNYFKSSAFLEPRMQEIENNLLKNRIR